MFNSKRIAALEEKQIQLEQAHKLINTRLDVHYNVLTNIYDTLRAVISRADSQDKLLELHQKHLELLDDITQVKGSNE